MREQGTIVGIENGRARVAMEQQEHCRGCGVCSRLGGNMELTVQLDDDSEVGIGDRVLLDIPAELSYGGIVLVYVVPLAGLLLGAAMGAMITRTWWLECPYPNLLSIVLSFAGLVGGFWFMSWCERRRQTPTRQQIHIVQVL